MRNQLTQFYRLNILKRFLTHKIIARSRAIYSKTRARERNAVNKNSRSFFREHNEFYARLRLSRIIFNFKVQRYTLTLTKDHP